MIEETRRRAYLTAMQVVSWLPRNVLPFAAPSRAELLQSQVEEIAAVEVAPIVETPVAREEKAPARPTIEVPRPSVQIPRPVIKAEPVVEDAQTNVEPTKAALITPPRFALQLLRAGDCAVLVELPTGESFQSRDPAYLLLKDLLRAAGLPDSPQQVGDGSPIRWPLLARGNLDQGPDAARDYVQGVLAGQLENQPCACLWLIGLPAIRYAGEAEEDAYNRELSIDGLGPAWALPGLELLMEEPQRKRELWQAMRRVMQRWKPAI